MYLKKLKMELAFDPAIPLLGKYLKGPKTLIQNKHPSVHCSVVYNCQDMEAAQVSIRRWVDKTTMGHLHIGILLSHKKEEILPFTNTRVDLENIMLSETSQSEKYKYHKILLMWNLMNKLN